MTTTLIVTFALWIVGSLAYKPVSEVTYRRRGRAS